MPRKFIPCHEKVRECIRARILSGKYASGSRMPPEVQLFQEFQASDSTVVRALNDLVREGLIVRRRGSGTFVADAAHPPLIAGRHLTLGILWHHSIRPKLFGSFCHKLSLGAMHAWGMQGMEPELEEDRAMTFTRGTWREPARGLTVECLANEWGGHNRAPALDVVRAANYDGMLTLGIIEERWLENLLKLDRPVVIVDFPSQRLGKRADLVYADPQAGYRDAVDYFIAQGLTRIHFVAASVWNPHVKIPDETRPSGCRYGKRTDPDSFLRLSTYRQAMDAHGLVFHEDHVHYLAGGGESELAAKLAALPKGEQPQALICHGNEQANKMIKACAEHGLPLEAAGGTDRPIIGPAHNILLNAHEMGETAGELLLRRIHQSDRPYLNVGIQMTFCEPSGRPAAQNKKVAQLA